MRTRVTFRLPSDLADALRELSNQTSFVEEALRDALGKTCPVCAGSGRVGWSPVRVSDFRRLSLPPLDSHRARQLRSIVRLARELAATEVKLAFENARGLVFSVERGRHVLLSGSVDGGTTRLGATN